MSTTLGPINASVLLLYVGGTPIAHTTDFSLKLDNTLIDATTRNSNGWAETISGIRKWSITCTGIVAYDDVNGFMTMLQGPINRSLFTLKFSTGITGDIFLSGSARISSISQTAKIEALSTWSGTFEGTAALTVGTN